MTRRDFVKYGVIGFSAYLLLKNFNREEPVSLPEQETRKEEIEHDIVIGLQVVAMGAAYLEYLVAGAALTIIAGVIDTLPAEAKSSESVEKVEELNRKAYEEYHKKIGELEHKEVQGGINSIVENVKNKKYDDALDNVHKVRDDVNDNKIVKELDKMSNYIRYLKNIDDVSNGDDRLYELNNTSDAIYNMQLCILLDRHGEKINEFTKNYNYQKNENISDELLVLRNLLLTIATLWYKHDFEKDIPLGYRDSLIKSREYFNIVNTNSLGHNNFANLIQDELALIRIKYELYEGANNQTLESMLNDIDNLSYRVADDEVKKYLKGIAYVCHKEFDSALRVSDSMDNKADAELIKLYVLIKRDGHECDSICEERFNEALDNLKGYDKYEYCEFVENHKSIIINLGYSPDTLCDSL